MRLNTVLWAQHLGRMTSFHWYIQANKKIYKTRAEQTLTELGFNVIDGEEFIFRKPVEHTRLEVVGMHDKPLPLDERHPDYEAVPCYKIQDSDVLVEGLQQAMVLTNTVEVKADVPSSVSRLEENLHISAETHERIQDAIMLSCALEATQKKLPKLTDPLRPAWNFPRVYGITDVQKNNLLCRNLVSVCERVSDLSGSRCQVPEAVFSVPLTAFGKRLQLELTSELLVTSAKAIPPLVLPGEVAGQPLPDLAPLHPTVSLKPFHFYQMQDSYPVLSSSRWPVAHTAMVHFNSTETSHVFDCPVSSQQRQGRGLLKCFAVAAAQARALYGESLQGDLPTPIVVQGVQTDGREFHFMVFQLNTLALETEGSGGARNALWNAAPLHLYGACCYHGGKPVLQDYNPAVLYRLLAFYNHE